MQFILTLSLSLLSYQEVNSFRFDSLKGFLKATFVFFFCLLLWLLSASPQKQELLVVENTNSICRPEAVGVLRFQATKKVNFLHLIFYRQVHMHGFGVS